MADSICSGFSVIKNILTLQLPLPHLPTDATGYCSFTRFSTTPIALCRRHHSSPMAGASPRWSVPLAARHFQARATSRRRRFLSQMAGRTPPQPRWLGCVAVSFDFLTATQRFEWREQKFEANSLPAVNGRALKADSRTSALPRTEAPACPGTGTRRQRQANRRPQQRDSAGRNRAPQNS